MGKTSRLAGYLCALALLAGCGTPSGGAAPTSSPVAPSIAMPTSTPDPTARLSRALTSSAATQPSASPALSIEEQAGMLNGLLESAERETFAGLWIQREPRYRIVVAFSRDGEQTLQRYPLSPELESQIELRAVEHSLAELVEARRQAGEFLRQAGLPFSLGVNIMENRAELYASDMALLEQALKESGFQLSPLITVVNQDSGDRRVPAVTPDPSVAFPQYKAEAGGFMQALIESPLVLQDGCLRVGAGTDAGYLVIWRAGFFLNRRGEALEVLDRAGAVVARVGEMLRMGGGVIETAENFERYLREPIPERCKGPYWVMGALGP